MYSKTYETINTKISETASRNRLKEKQIEREDTRKRQGCGKWKVEEN